MKGNNKDMKRMWSEEEIQSFKKDISNLVDSKGNPRFVEGEGTLATIEGVTFTYNKWSLSGTHLMIVIAGSVTNGSTLPILSDYATFNIPKWIYDKVSVTFSNVVEIKVCDFRASDYSQQIKNFNLVKDNNVLKIASGSSVTLTADRYFHLQFDLLIDSE